MPSAGPQPPVCFEGQRDIRTGHLLLQLSPGPNAFNLGFKILMGRRQRLRIAHQRPNLPFLYHLCPSPLIFDMAIGGSNNSQQGPQGCRLALFLARALAAWRDRWPLSIPDGAAKERGTCRLAWPLAASCRPGQTHSPAAADHSYDWPQPIPMPAATSGCDLRTWSRSVSMVRINSPRLM